MSQTTPHAPEMIHGLSAFPITPADPAGRIDTDGLVRLVQRLAAAEVDSIGLLGSTGTYAYLTRAERRRAVEAVSASPQPSNCLRADRSMPVWRIKTSLRPRPGVHESA